MERNINKVEAGESLMMLLLSELLLGSEPYQTIQTLSMLAISAEKETALKIFSEREVKELQLLGH